MSCDKRYFLDFLHGNGKVSVLFEPFLSHTHTETLIWRRGEHLWNTVEHTLETLTYLTEHTQSDMVFIDIRDYSSEKKDEVMSVIPKFRNNNEVGYAVICDSNDISMCEPYFDCLCVYGNGTSDKLPIIRMDSSIENAISQGDSGWFCRENAEYYLEKYSDKIRILSGIGTEWTSNSSPVQIHSRIEKLSREYSGKWACGSGGIIPANNYLELISMLSAFKRWR